MPRDDFPEKVRRTAALRTGHRCSICRAHTSGPQSREDGVLNVGEAAHISAASPGGPRFDPALSSEQRTGVSNAIWLCRNCAKLIDNDVARFPRELLTILKKRAEADAFTELGKPQVIAGEIEHASAISEIKQAVKEAIAESGPTSSSYDAEIESAVTEIKAFRYEVARILLQRLRTDHWTDLSDRQKFRVVTNIGATFLGEGDLVRAAHAYRDAKVFQPDDQKAWENEALAHELLDEKSQATELARKICGRWPESARALGIVLAELPANTTIEEIESEIPSSLANEPEICLVMSRRAAALRNFAISEKYARRAVDKLPDRAQAVFLAGQVILASVLADSWGKHAEIVIDQNSARLAEAEDYLSRAIALAKSEKASELQAHALVTRSCLYEIEGEKAKCEQDIEQAHHLLPNYPPVLVSYARLLHSRGDIDGAVVALRQALDSSKSDEAAFLLANLLRERGSNEDLKEALSLLTSLAVTEEALADGLREHVVSCAFYLAKELQDFDRVNQLLEKIPAGKLSQSALQILRVRLALAHGQQGHANELADNALKDLPTDARADDRRNLAMVLSQLSRFEDALPLWQKIAPLDSFGSDTKYLLDCAFRTERHGMALDICNALRAAGVDNPEVFETQMVVLEQYAPEEALELLRTEVMKHPEDRVLQLHLSILGLRLNRPDVVAANVAQVPAPDTVSARDAIFAVRVLRSRGDPNDAVKYAYEVLRLHFNDVDAHRAYVSAMGPGEHPPIIPSYDRALPGCAVRFVVENSSDERCVIIEDSSSLDASRAEISSESSLAKELLNKKVGDSFEVSAFARGTIKEITSKFIFRYQDCLTQWQFRFSDNPDILSFQIASSDKSDSGSLERDFAPMVAMMREHEKRRGEVEKLYSTNLVPIHLVAKALGINDLEAIAGLAHGSDVVIRCCDGSAPEREAAQKTVNEQSSLVLDITAIATLILLDRVSLLRAFSGRLIVSSSTVAILEEMLRREESHREDSLGFVRSVGDRPQFVMESEEARQRRLKAFKELLDTVRTSCDVRRCLQLPYLDPDKRQTLVELFGPHGAESIILSCEPGSALWTDDLTVAGYARELYGVPRVWTHAVLQEMAKKGGLDESGYLEATAKLAGFGYFFTSINAASAVIAGRMAGWNPDRWPLKGSLRYLQVETIELSQSTKLARELILRMYNEDLLPETRNVAVIAVLEALGKRQSGMAAIRAVRETLPGAFGLNVIGAYDALQTIDAWLASKAH